MKNLTKVLALSILMMFSCDEPEVEPTNDPTTDPVELLCLITGVTGNNTSYDLIYEDNLLSRVNTSGGLTTHTEYSYEEELITKSTFDDAGVLTKTSIYEFNSNNQLLKLVTEDSWETTITTYAYTDDGKVADASKTSTLSDVTTTSVYTWTDDNISSLVIEGDGYVLMNTYTYSSEDAILAPEVGIPIFELIYQDRDINLLYNKNILTEISYEITDGGGLHTGTEEIFHMYNTEGVLTDISYGDKNYSITFECN